MNKNIKLSILFTSVLLAAICLVQFAIVKCYQKRATQKFTKIFNHAVDPEIMIFGSSVAYHELDPKVIGKTTGMTAYNMGLDGLFFVQYEALIREFLSYEHNCKYIIIGHDFENFGKNNLITRPDLFLAYINNDFVYNSLSGIEPEKMFKARYLPGYALTLMNKSFYSNILLNSLSDSLLGYNPMQATPELVKNFGDFDAAYEDKIYNRLKSCLEDINKKGIKVIIVMMPITREGYGKIKNAPFIEEKTRGLVNDNVHFLNYSADPMADSVGYFINLSHMNKTGSTIFSTKFSKDLLKIIK